MCALHARGGGGAAASTHAMPISRAAVGQLMWKARPKTCSGQAAGLNAIGRFERPRTLLE